MEIFYINSENKKIVLSEWPIAIEDVTELFAKEWKYEITENRNTNSSKIGKFYRTTDQKKISISIYADSEDEYKKCVESFEEMTETDILNEKPGKLWCNGYYLSCYIIADSPKDYEEEFYTIDNTITIIAEYPFWISENEYTFSSYGISSSDNKRYPGRYPYRYANGLNNVYIINPHFIDSNFKLIVYGPVVNPMVSIGENRYLINIILDEGEYLEIDSRAGTVVKVMINGERVDAFHNREKKRTFFKKIPPGRQNVVWTGKFSFDLTIYEERSKPKWST